MEEKKYRVEIFEYATGKISAIIGKNMSERQADKREITGLSRCNEDFGCRIVEEDDIKK